MIRLALIRHAPTAWNAEGRLQGRRDEPLSPAGRAAAAAWRLPPAFDGWDLVASPLVRAVETARLMTGRAPTLVPALAEMDWGIGEGRLRAELAAGDEAFQAEAARGLDLSPPGGESPRAVQARALGWIAGLSRDTVAVAHKGVIRALCAAAWGWDMIGRPPERLLWDRAHVLERTSDGGLAVAALNQELA